MNKRGISAVIATVLLILITFMSASTLLIFVNRFNEISLNSNSNDLSIITSEGFTTWDEENKSLSLHIKRGGENSSLKKIQVLFFIKGNSFEFLITDIPNINEKKVYKFDLSSLGEKPTKISIAGIYSIEGGPSSIASEITKINEGKIKGELINISENESTNDPENISLQGGFPDLTKKVLILYNINEVDSLEIAQYYASKRGIDSSKICGIHLPTGQFATADQLLGAKRTIVEDCLCNLFGGSISGTCDESKIDEIADISTLSHLAIIRGIPPRLTGTGWSGPSGSDSEEPSLDYYLANMIYKDYNIFTETSGQLPNQTYLGYLDNNIDFQPKPGHEDWYIRSINVSLDRMFAYGRIEAINKQRTFELIDRTLVAENNGIQGNFMVSSSYPLNKLVSRTLRDLSSSWDTSCEDYLSHPTNEWPYDSCRVSFSDLGGSIQGESLSKTPIPINAGIYIGRNPTGNGHSAFDGFNNMINWHKSEYTCTELCEDLSTQKEIDNCKASSTDYFKVINTDCVGVAEGFMGYQFRSYPVQYYGFWPSGWINDASGNWEKTPPKILSEGSNNYLHFGSNSISNPSCYLGNGSFASCEEIIAVSLIRNSNTGLNIPINTNLDNLTLKFNHRNTENSNSYLRFYLEVFYGTNTGTRSGPDYFKTTFEDYSLDQENLAWKEGQVEFNIEDSSGKTINRIYLHINSHFFLGDKIKGYLDLDDIQIYDESLNPILNQDIISFNDISNDRTNYGGYAPDVIDRLGGIGWWGSSSHFLTGGSSFFESRFFIRVFYSGKTIGESLAFDSAFSPKFPRGMAAIIYIDPLYNPSGVKIYSNKTDSKLGDKLYGETIYSTDLSGQDHFINAFHGKGKINTNHWNLSICEDITAIICDSNNNWIELDSGSRGVFNYETTKIKEYLSLETGDKDFYLKLRVWNPGEEENDLTSYGRIKYKI